MAFHFVSFGCLDFRFLRWLFREWDWYVAPSDKVGNSTLLSVENALFVFVTNIGLHFVLFLVKTRRLQSHAVRQIGWESQVNKLSDFLA